MKIKKFLAPSLKEALAQIKGEMGDEAVILSTKNLKQNGSSRVVFEVVAGVEEDTPVAKLNKNIKKRIETGDESGFDSELKILRQKIYQGAGKQPKTEPKNPEINKTEQKKSPFDEQLAEIKSILVINDVSSRLAEKIILQIKNQLNLLKKPATNDFITSVVSSLIPTEGFEVKKRNTPKVVALVGPTGVGKTTCVAKLALISKILHKLNVGLISIDTYRLGAIDQLKTFAELSEIEMLVAYKAADVPKIMKKFAKKDLVFVDTVGRSQNNAAQLKEIGQTLSGVKIDETMLVLNTTGATKNLVDVAKKFKVLNYSGLIFTKLDESVSYGNILNTANEMNVPVKFLTNGQVIPDDIIAADPDYIAKLIYTGKLS
jgi:flagellar biosynthesis protein FlhF